MTEALDLIILKIFIYQNFTVYFRVDFLRLSRKIVVLSDEENRKKIGKRIEKDFLRKF